MPIWKILALDAVIFVAAVFAYRAVRQFARALRRPDEDDSSQVLIRAIRSLVVVFCAVVLVIAILRESRTALILAAAVLAEEMYETARALLILKKGERSRGGRR